jgi:hypothetical protein
MIDVRLSEKAPYPLFDITIFASSQGLKNGAECLPGSYNDPRGASRYRRWGPGFYFSQRTFS